MAKADMLQFVTQAQDFPAKRKAAERAHDFAEIAERYAAPDAATQAARCSQCGVPYCSVHCPLHNHIPDWLRLAAEGRLQEAYALSNATSTMPEICGRICPQDRLCEGACTLNDDFGAVTIGAVEKYIVDTAFAQGWRPDLSKVVASGKHVAVIGAGPAGLACADRLVRSGIAVTVFDRYEQIGGLMQFGIPSFKLDKAVIATRREVLEGMGVVFKLGVEIGHHLRLEHLLTGYDAVFLGLGAYRYTDGGLPGQDLAGVLPALPFLVQNGRIVTGNDPHGRPIAGWEDTLAMPDLRGKRVVVLGGGDTGMDCVRSAVRLGAASVTCAYRRDEANMPGSAREVANAREEGVQFLFNRQPLAVESSDGKAASGVRMVETRLGAPDANGRRNPEPIAGSESVVAADIVIIAFGFSPKVPDWLAAQGVQAQPNGRLAVGGNGRLAYQTGHDKLFAGGDCVRGADLVVTAVQEGRDAAASIARMVLRGVRAIPAALESA